MESTQSSLPVSEDIIHDVKSEHHLCNNINPLCPECTRHVSQLRRPLASPLEHLLSDTSRHLPSPEEELQVRHVVDDATKRIFEIDSTTAQIRLLLDELAVERAKIQDYADKHKVMIAPVWELPPEILSYIFVLCLPRHPPQDIKRSALQRSLILSWVNHHWREVATRTPQLWTTVSLDLKSFSDEEGHTCMPKVFLERSGTRPLSLSVRANEHSTEMLDLIIPLSPRWQRIVFDTALTMLQALSPIENQLPSLQTLEIKDAHWREDNPNYLACFSNAPLLHHVAISTSFLSNFCVLPWHQLTTWDSPVALQDFPRIFELAPNLEECFFQPMRQVIAQTIPESETGVAHKLTSLHISTGSVVNMVIQLQHLPHFPALRRLFLYFDKRANAQNGLVTLFSKSGANLETLTFGVGAPISTIRNCLTHTPLLTTLHIHRVANDPLLASLVLPNPGGNQLLPKLEILRLSGKVYFSPEAVIKIIRSRWQRPSSTLSSESNSNDSESGMEAQGTHARCLRSVHILPPRHDNFNAQSKKKLLAFSKKGFDVQIHRLDRTAFLSHHTPFTSPHPPPVSKSSADAA